MVWRNHIYNIIINAFGPIKELAPHLHQLGYRWAPSSRGRRCACTAGHCTWLQAGFWGTRRLE